MTWYDRTTRHASHVKGFLRKILPFSWLPVLLLCMASCDWFIMPDQTATMPTLDPTIGRTEPTVPASPAPTTPATSPVLFTPPAVNRLIRGAYYAYTPIADVPASYYTHIYHSFLHSDNNGRLLFNTRPAEGAASFADLAAPFVAHCHKGGAAAMLSLGGGMDKSFHTFTRDAAKRQAYARAVVAVVKRYGYDGVDIDWEQPGNAAEQRQWASLVSELRAGLDALARADGKKYWLTAAVGTSKWNASWFDIPTIRTKLDFINLMAYDYIGAWGGDPAGDQAALETQRFGGHSTRKGLEFWQRRGIKPSQIVIGLPFYTRACFGYKPGQIIQRNSPSGKRVISFGYDKFLAYAAQKRWTYRLNPATKVRWYTSPGGSHFAAVDGPEAVAHKTRFADTKGYRGVFCWATYHNPGKQLQKAMAKPQR